MALEKFNADLNIIDKIPIDPATGGFNSETFRSSFDKAGLLIQKYINDVIYPILLGVTDINVLVTVPEPVEDNNPATKLYVDTLGSKRVSMLAQAVELPASEWSGNEQTVWVSGVTEKSNALVLPAPETYMAYVDSVVYCTAQGDGYLSFACDEVPEENVAANVLILKQEEVDYDI